MYLVYTFFLFLFFFFLTIFTTTCTKLVCLSIKLVFLRMYVLLFEFACVLMCYFDVLNKYVLPYFVVKYYKFVVGLFVAIVFFLCYGYHFI